VSIRAFALLSISLLGLAQEPLLLPFAEVKPGMRGHGLTVFQGVKPERFEVEILGALENTGPKQSIFIARLSGGPLEKTGVMQGMSGSPVYINGRLIGAVAFAFPFAKEPIAGIRPIEEMLEAVHETRAQGTQAGLTLAANSLVEHLPAPLQVNGDSRQALDMATPVSFSGFTQRTLEVFAPQLARLGLAVQQGGLGSASNTYSANAGKRLQPGEMISLQLMRGDLNSGADGTVTMVSGDRIYAFGHRFLSTGFAEIPFARSEVQALLASVNTSFKMSTARETLGVITEDRNTAVAGYVGRKAKLARTQIELRSAGRTTNYQMEMVRHRALTPFLLQMAVYSLLDGREKITGPGFVQMEGTIEFEGNLPPLQLRNAWATDTLTPLAASLGGSLPLAYLMQSAAEELPIRTIQMKLEAAEDKRQWTIDRFWCSQRNARPGDEVTLSVAFTKDGREEVRDVRWRVPMHLSSGPLTLVAADGATSNLMTHRGLYQTAPGTLPMSTPELIEQLNQLAGGDAALITVLRSANSWRSGSADMIAPPPSIALSLSRLPGAAQVLESTQLTQLALRPPEGAINGSRTITLEIRN
jgi:hypothetical protein